MLQATNSLHLAHPRLAKWINQPFVSRKTERSHANLFWKWSQVVSNTVIQAQENARLPGFVEATAFSSCVCFSWSWINKLYKAMNPEFVQAGQALHFVKTLEPKDCLVQRSEIPFKTWIRAKLSSGRNSWSILCRLQLNGLLDYSTSNTLACIYQWGEAPPSFDTSSGLSSSNLQGFLLIPWSQF